MDDGNGDGDGDARDGMGKGEGIGTVDGDGDGDGNCDGDGDGNGDCGDRFFGRNTKECTLLQGSFPRLQRGPGKLKFFYLHTRRIKTIQIAPSLPCFYQGPDHSLAVFVPGLLLLPPARCLLEKHLASLLVQPSL